MTAEFVPYIAWISPSGYVRIVITGPHYLVVEVQGDPDALGNVAWETSSDRGLGYYELYELLEQAKLLQNNKVQRP